MKRALYYVIFSMYTSLSLKKQKLIVTIFYYFVDSTRLTKYVDAVKEFILLLLGNFKLRLKAANSNHLLQNQNCFGGKV